MKTPDSSIYTREYFNVHSVGYENILHKIKPYLEISENMYILDMGCGIGNLVIYMASKGAHVIGIDYSSDAIAMAKEKLNNQKKYIRDRVVFKTMDARSMSFKENYFDYVISIDIFEHIAQDELEDIMKKISQILKPGGKLLVHTEPNKFYLNFTHRYYIYPLSTFLIFTNRILNGNNYPNLPKDPRNELHKIQHVNEPTYFYLKDLFKRYNFEGKIISVGIYKPHLSWKDVLYNIVVLLYPFSLLPPLSWLFTYDYICVMANEK